MTTNSYAPTASDVECVPAYVTQLLHEQYPEELAAIGIPVCCLTENDLWAAPVRFQCGTYHFVFCRLEASAVQLIQPPAQVTRLRPRSIRLPSLVLEEQTLHVVVHTDQGDQRFPF